MNETKNRTSASDVPWSPSDPQAQEPGASMLPGSQSIPPAMAGFAKDSARDAHDSIDRFADSAAPTLQQPADRVSSAAETLRANTDPLRETREDWIEGVRSTVRANPLASLAGALAGALALGALIARLRR